MLRLISNFESSRSDFKSVHSSFVANHEAGNLVIPVELHSTAFSRHDVQRHARDEGADIRRKMSQWQEAATKPHHVRTQENVAGTYCSDMQHTRGNVLLQHFPERYILLTVYML